MPSYTRPASKPVIFGSNHHQYLWRSVERNNTERLHPSVKRDGGCHGLELHFTQWHWESCQNWWILTPSVPSVKCDWQQLDFFTWQWSQTHFQYSKSITGLKRCATLSVMNQRVLTVMMNEGRHNKYWLTKCIYAIYTVIYTVFPCMFAHVSINCYTHFQIS